MVTRMLAALCAVLGLSGAVGWGLWWARGVQVEKARQERDAYKLALHQCHRNADALQAALDEQNAAVQRLANAAKRLQNRLDEAAKAEAMAKAEAAAQAALRAKERQRLEERLKRMEELPACREAWHWLKAVEDE